MASILIYGANGYSGRLAAIHAADLSLDVILAGRNREGIEKVALETGLPQRIFGLEDSEAIDAGLDGISVVLNCAGPFSRTAKALTDACLRNGVHYLDITGEVAVIESLAQRDSDARRQGITLMPATGFDVVPTDCMAAYLKAKLPDATHLDLAFQSQGGVSHGTAMTMVENLGGSSVSRQNGLIVAEPLAARIMKVPFQNDARSVMSIPWGDVASAYYTTGIPNIRTFMAVPTSTARWMHRSQRLHGIAGLPLIKKLAERIVARRVTGPDAHARATGRAFVWGRARNDLGQQVTAVLSTLESYTLTYRTSIDLARRAQRGELPLGFQTPAGAMGADYILSFDASFFRDVGAR